MLLVLHVEDSAEDSLLITAELERSFGAVVCRRVETAEAFLEALRTERWDVVLADHRLPGFSALAALGLLRRTGLDLPFIIVSGTLGEELAVEALRAGAQDFVTKGKLARLAPAIERELRDAAVRRERRLAEDQLHQVEARLELVLRSNQDLIFTFDRDLRITSVYGGRHRTDRLAPADALGHTPRELLGAHGAPVEARWKEVLAGADAVFEWSRPGEDGRLHYFQTSASPLRGPAGALEGGVGITRDVTRSRELESQLAASDRLVAVGTLAASVAHEINNPLSAALANLALAQEALADLPGAAACAGLADTIADAREAVGRVREIVGDLRLLAREKAREGSACLPAVIASASRLARNEIQHRARLVTECDPSTPPVRCSEGRLGQVLLNLLVNAAQAIPEGRADANRITVRTAALPEGRVSIEVADTGCGMTPATRERLFTPFFTTKPPGQGTGLGLTISRRIVEEQGGTLEVESEPGRGSLFRVTLPAAAIEARATGPAAPPSPPPSPARRARVLVIDDDVRVARSIQRILAPRHDVELAQPREAVALVERGERYGVILCDLMMPTMSGMEVHARVLEADPAQAGRMIFLTGGAFTPAAQAFLDRGVPWLQKPFDAEALRRAVAGEAP